MTLVQNEDGTIEQRAPRAGEGVVGLVADGIELPKNPQTTRAALADPPAALDTYEHPSFDALAGLSAGDTAIIEQFKQWSAKEPPAPATVAGLNDWMVAFADWMLAVPTELVLSSTGLTAAARGFSAERLFSASIRAMPAQVSAADFAPAWRKQMWNAAAPWLQRAQEHYASCIEAKEPRVNEVCRSRLQALDKLKATTNE